MAWVWNHHARPGVEPAATTPSCRRGAGACAIAPPLLHAGPWLCLLRIGSTGDLRRRRSAALARGLCCASTSDVTAPPPTCGGTSLPAAVAHLSSSPLSISGDIRGLHIGRLCSAPSPSSSKARHLLPIRWSSLGIWLRRLPRPSQQDAPPWSLRGSTRVARFSFQLGVLLAVLFIRLLQHLIEAEYLICPVDIR